MVSIIIITANSRELALISAVQTITAEVAYEKCLPDLAISLHVVIPFPFLVLQRNKVKSKLISHDTYIVFAEKLVFPV